MSSSVAKLCAWWDACYKIVRSQAVYVIDGVVLDIGCAVVYGILTSQLIAWNALMSSFF